MEETVKCFLDCYSKMLKHAQDIVEWFPSTKGMLAYLMSFSETSDNSVRIEWHNPEGPEYGVLVLPIPEFYKNPENMDVNSVIEQ